MTNGQNAFRTIIESTSLDERATLITSLRDYKVHLAPYLGTDELRNDFDGKVAQALENGDRQGVLKIGVEEVIAMYFSLKGNPEQDYFTDFLKGHLSPALFEKFRIAVAEDTGIRLNHIWQARKSDRDIPDEDKALVYDMFWGGLEHQFDAGLYAYVLLFDCDDKGLQRYRMAFEYFRANDVFDERAAAVITAVCNYWHSARYFEPELRAVLQEWPWEEEATVCTAAIICFGALTFETKSQERLNFLKQIAFDLYGSTELTGDDFLKDVIIRAGCGMGANCQRLRQTIHTKEDLLRFEFQ